MSIATASAPTPETASRRTSTPPTPPSADDEQRYTRLSVNVALDVAEALRTLTKRRGITITDGVRRAIAIWKLVEDASAKGQQVQIVDPATGNVRELVLV